MASLNVVALISGGKDSLFSILHCQANGHNIIALANLHPPDRPHEGPSEDLESYMYQTIGHAVIPLYQQALELPLYRQEIGGTAINRDKSYGPPSSTTTTDETESLLPLLRKVLQAHPEVNAVSTGAILSDYQRTRVESVALRLGLTTLAYLWQWPTLPPHTQTSLLEDMAAVGQDARIIKVASGGLDDSFLWQNVADRRTISRLSMAAARFGADGDGAVLGEGGEYETLAIDGPSPLWKARIDVSHDSVNVLPGEAGSASLRITAPLVVPRDENKSLVIELRVPPLLEETFEHLRDEMCIEHAEHAESDTTPSTTCPTPSEEYIDGAVVLPNLTGGGSTASEQTRIIMEEIITRLESHGHKIHDIAYSIIVLRDMADFGAVNAVYGSYFFKPCPPARVTIACADALPFSALLSIGITSSNGPRDGLHVQSRSYWAPANIGPYSQAIKFPPTSQSAVTRASVFIAGQIPLEPASMQLPNISHMSWEESFAQQAALSLQHLQRIGQAMEVKQWVYGIAFVATTDDAAIPVNRKAVFLRRAWEAFHRHADSGQGAADEDDDFDVWDLKHGPGSVPWRRQISESTHGETTQGQVPPLVVMRVDGLPRGSAIEWVGFGKSVQEDADSSSAPPHLRGLLHVFRTRVVPQ